MPAAISAAGAGATSARLSPAMDRTSQWVLSQEIPTDVVVHVGDAKFPLHKFLLVAKSGLIRRKILDADNADLVVLDLSDVPGGAETFELAAKFCYGFNFEISIHNVAALHCAADFLDMADRHCPGNLASRTDEFLSRAALKSLTGAISVLRSCDPLLPHADHLLLVQRCVDAIAMKACLEANFPSRSPLEWWAAELAGVPPAAFQKILTAMKARGATPKTLSTAVATYVEKSLPKLVSVTGPGGVSSSDPGRARQRGLLESIIAVLPADRDASLPVGFLCCILRAAIFLDCAASCRRELEKRVSALLDQAAAGDLLTVALDYTGDHVADLDSVRHIVAGFVESEMGGGAAFYSGDGGVPSSPSVQKVARAVDAFIAEIATEEGLAVSKFVGVAGAIPKSARRFDDDLYRAIDIYLKSHPELDEIEKEKVCSVMDPLKLSYEARVHASQNKRLPLQIVLHALYYDQLKLRSGGVAAVPGETAGGEARGRAAADASLMRENEELRSELTRMKMYMSDLGRSQGSSASGAKATGAKGKKFLSSVSRTLGRLNPFGRHGAKDASGVDVRRHGSKDTSSIDDGPKGEAMKPRRRRFSLS